MSYPIEGSTATSIGPDNPVMSTDLYFPSNSATSILLPKSMHETRSITIKNFTYASV